METLTALLRQATQLHQIPATCRTLQSPDIRILYAIDCGKLQLWRQPYRGVYRDVKTVTSIAFRALVSAVLPYLTSRSPLNEETFPFLTKLLGATSNSQHTVPRTVLELPTRLHEFETLSSAPFGHHDSDEQLFGSHAWCSLTMLAALELPDVPFHELLSTCTTTALQDVISRGRARFVQAASEQPPSTPTDSEVCKLLQLF